MFKEIKSKETGEIKSPEKKNFQDIKPKGDFKEGESKGFFKNLFENMEKSKPERYSTEQERYDKTPKNGVNGGWIKGERGNGVFAPNPENPICKKIIEKLKEYGLEGIKYKNGEADFSKCAEETVKIDHMTESRPSNFAQADTILAVKWNKEKKDGKINWKTENVAKYREKNNLTWHERNDTKTMDLVSRDIHPDGKGQSIFTHLGGVSECKIRDHGRMEDNFDA